MHILPADIQQIIRQLANTANIEMKNKQCMAEKGTLSFSVTNTNVGKNYIHQGESHSELLKRMKMTRTWHLSPTAQN